VPNQFTGGLFARVGGGANYGGAGTIYLKADTNAVAQVLVDNGGSRGTNSSLASSGLFDLTVSGGAVIETPTSLPGTALQIRNLLIGSNSFLIGSRSLPQQSSVLSVSNATILTGGGFVLDGQGFAGSQGAGAGRTTSSYYGSTGGGGGYAGYGGTSGFGSAGGNSYGSVSSPTDLGSGGGFGSGTPSLGGSGGGSLHLSVNGVLALDGRISADGFPGVGQGSGGGSGGSIWVTAGNLSGRGGFSANGAAGDSPYGGGGGGGRIAVYYDGSQFTGTISARGGPGATYGGAGTVYLKSNNSQSGQVSVDNGGPLGTNTPLSLSSAFDLTVGGGAIVNPVPGIVVGNLLVQSNAWLSQLPLPHGNSQWTVSGNAIIQAGGGISLDGQGSLGGLGTGAGDSNNNGGGGYGGYGGNFPGGNAYGSLLQPVDAGSGGGRNPSTAAVGGTGGGALHLIVNNTLALDGQISAAGGSGMFGGGGGSGGSIWLTVSNLAGAGIIAADGGPGDFPSGGGGGGGRVALYYTTQQFTGLISARGGAGTIFGGAGTVYSKGASNSVGQVVVDNGGSNGTNTPLSSPETFDLTILGGAVVNPSGPALMLSSLLVDSGANLTHLNTQSNLDLIVLGHTTIGTNGSIAINGKGFSGSNGGPGAGLMASGSSGSGGGYGGPGGTSAAGTPGGITYGSAAQPVDRGSRGGLEYPFSNTNFCQGGGAVRMRVSGT